MNPLVQDEFLQHLSFRTTDENEDRYLHIGGNIFQEWFHRCRGDLHAGKSQNYDIHFLGIVDDLPDGTLRDGCALELQRVPNAVPG